MNSTSCPFMLQKIANTIRSLTLDAVEQAGSGHPGLPLGCAELGAYLFSEFLLYDPQCPKWGGRDRLILSAGHGSLWLYICFHLSGFPLSIDDLKQFRQFGSKTPSHPDFRKTPGIEATTGVDGQGVGFAVGQALALKIHSLPAKAVVLAGDGCLMEGVSSESCSLAGHLGLDNLIVLYDCNKTTLDGYVYETFSEDIPLRFKAQGWDVFEIDGHCFSDIENTLSPLRSEQKRPTLIIAHTTIGRGSPSFQGTPAAHGRPFGKEEVEKVKQNLGLSMQPFDVDPQVYAFFKAKQSSSFQKTSHPPSSLKSNSLLEKLSLPSPLATRFASHEILQKLAMDLPTMIVGSADLSSSDGTYLRDFGTISRENFQGRNIKYGVREFAMGCIAAGMAETGLIFPVIGTFLAFSDYMKSAIRLSCLMRLKIVYHLTHDSLFVGRDGPTHQPIEQLSSLRAIPHLLVFRPADSHETQAGWIAALESKGPAALILSRQPLENLPVQAPFSEILKGAYIVSQEKGPVDFLLIATGSEVSLAYAVAQELGPNVRVVSMPSWELFEKQPDTYKNLLLQGRFKISIEAGVEQGWHKYIGPEGLAISLADFGECGSIQDLQEHFGYSKKSILQKIADRFKM